MERLAVKDAKDFSKDQFANNWVINAEEIRIARWQSTTVIDANIAGFRNVWRWECGVIVRITIFWILFLAFLSCLFFISISLYHYAWWPWCFFTFNYLFECFNRRPPINWFKNHHNRHWDASLPMDCKRRYSYLVFKHEYIPFLTVNYKWLLYNDTKIPIKRLML